MATKKLKAVLTEAEVLAVIEVLDRFGHEDIRDPAALKRAKGKLEDCLEEPIEPPQADTEPLRGCSTSFALIID